jgi:hypothetical protein
LSRSLHRRACALGLTLTLVAACTATAASPTPNGVDYSEGKAINPSSGSLMYVEAHWVYDDGDDASRLVLYRCPDGTPFARKITHDHGHPQSPDFALDDGRTGYQEGVRSEGGKRIVYQRDHKGARERTATLEKSPMPVIDAGFDAYIRHHWDSLGKNGGDTIPFVLPSRLGTLRFKVQRMDDAKIGGRDVRQYQLGLASWIGFALPHIDVAYDIKTRELLRFSGMANIHASNGDNVKAGIVFDPGKNKQVNRADVDAASRTALDGQCHIP